jgi:hypothetical protein
VAASAASGVVQARAGGVLSERIVEFAERGEDTQTGRSISGVRQMPEPAPAASGSLAELIDPGPARQQALAVEAAIARGDYGAAVRKAGEQLARAARSSSADGDGPTMVALRYRLPVERFLRMRELLRRVDSGAISLQDAVFALFFLVDLELLRAARPEL